MPLKFNKLSCKDYNLLMDNSTKKKIAQLYSLTNQIRLQLRQVKRQPPYYCQSRSTSQKKHFVDKSKATNILQPSQLPQPEYQKISKKHYDNSDMAYQNFNKFIQRKHFEKHYKDSVDTSISAHRRRSSHMHVKTEVSTSRQSNRSNILLGIGQKSQKTQRRNSCIRLYPQRYTMRNGIV